MKTAITREERNRLVALKARSGLLSGTIEQLAGEADDILGDSGMNSFGDDLIWNSHDETVDVWLEKNGVMVA